MTPVEREVVLARRLERERNARKEAERIGESELRRIYQTTREQQLISKVVSAANRARTIRAAFSESLALLRVHTGFAVGHVWEIDEEGAARSAGIWCTDPLPTDFEDLVRAATRGRTFRAFEGLPGDVLATARPLWLPDIEMATNFPRAAIIGAGSAFAFPIMCGDSVAAVMELLDPQPRAADAPLLELCTTIGEELGRVVERERAARRERQQMESLEARVRERTTALTQARDAAAAAGRAKDTFLAAVSNELGTPLQGIAASLDAIDASGLDDQTRTFISDAKRSTLRLSQLVDQLLVVVGAEDPRKPAAALHMVKPIDLLAEAYGWVFDSYPDLDQRVSRRAGPGAEAAVLLNDELVVQATAALLDNAARHTSGPIELSTRNDDSWLTFTVSDSGPGIPAEMVEGLLEPFSIGDTTSHGGLGIGLAVANRLAHLLGGQLVIDARPHGGTEARLVIPVASPLATPSSSAVRRVLLVDDTDGSRRLIMAMLKRLGVPCDEVVDGFAALSAMQDTRYALVLMDLEMPGIDGCETTGRWRSGVGIRDTAKTDRDVAVVAITAASQATHRRACMQAGMNDLLAKPFRMDDLKAVLEKWHPGIVTS